MSIQSLAPVKKQKTKRKLEKEKKKHSKQTNRAIKRERILKKMSDWNSDKNVADYIDN